MHRLWIVIAAIGALGLALAGCSKGSGDDPQIFVPQFQSPNGQNLDQARARACDPSKVDLTNNVLTQQNFQAMFACANYDQTLTPLQPLFSSAEFPELIQDINTITKSQNAQGIKDTLRDWLADGPDGSSKADRLLPFLSSLIKNPSFQDFLPVLSNMLQAGKPIWKDLLPGLADVVYTDTYPANLDEAVNVFNSFSPASADQGGQGAKDYATAIKDLARFLKTDVDGKTASLQALELADQVSTLKPDGTSLYEFTHHLWAFGSINEYFDFNGNVRGEVVDPKLNDAPDDPDQACPNLNDTPEQRQQCASQRMYQRGQDGSDAPIVQLAGLVVELERSHPELMTSLAAWFSANGDRVSRGLSDYVVRAQVVTNLSRLNVGTFLQQFAANAQNGIDPNAPVSSAQFASFLQKAFASPDFAAWVGTLLPQINKAAFGEKNAAALASSTLRADIAALYQAPEVAAFAQVLIPAGQTAPLANAIRKFSNKHRTDALQVAFRGTTQPIEKHLGDIWIAVVKADLGEDLVLDYVIKLAQTLLTQMANDFKDKNQPIAEWYFDSPYGNPASTEMIVGYATHELDLLTKYYQNKDWLENSFANEVFGDNADDKRAFRLLVDQVPNIVLYVRSGMARSGADINRAMMVDTDGYLEKTYVQLIVKATQTGWVRKAVRLIEAYQATPDYKRHAVLPMSDDIRDRTDYEEGVEALDKIVRSLITPSAEGDYSTSTLGRLMVPVASVVGPARRGDAEKLLLTSADQLLGLSDQQINDFMNNLHAATPPGSANTRWESYKSVSDMMKNPACPDLVLHLSGLFQEQAVRPALDFFARKIDDGSLPRVLRFIRRLLGFGT